MLEFTSDWFTRNIPNFEHIKNNLQTNLGSIDAILEVGAHEGRATCWMMQNMLSDTGTIISVDPFANYHVNPFTGEFPTAERTWENRFRSNTQQARKPKQTQIVHVACSFPILAQLIVERKQFDFIYIDGNHCSDAVLADAVMAWGLLKPGGIMLFDDYLSEDESDVLNRSKMSIDAFCNAFIKQLNWYVTGYQLAIGKQSKGD
jgi:predicted O-methyltransferase YrrM